MKIYYICLIIKMRKDNMSRFLQNIGNKTLNFFQEIGQVSQLLWGIIKSFSSIPRSRKIIFYQMEHIGVNSLPLVMIIAVFTGAVAAWQAAYQLKGIAPLSFLGAATSRAIITELGSRFNGNCNSGKSRRIDCC